jgi:hypothetical protein
MHSAGSSHDEEATMRQPITLQSQTYAYCQSSKHSRRKRIAIFSELGLLAWCKECKTSVLISWGELDRIRTSFQPPPGAA